MTELQLQGPIKGTELPESWAAVVSTMKTWASCRRRSYWFALVDGDVVAGVGALDPGTETEKPWLGPTMILPEFRRRGGQVTLIKARLELAQEMGIPIVYSAVDIGNSASLKNMLNAGFRSTEYDTEHEHICLTWRL